MADPKTNMACSVDNVEGYSVIHSFVYSFIKEVEGTYSEVPQSNYRDAN